MKKWLCVALVLLLAMTLLWGCGGNTEESDGGEKVYCVVSEREYDADGVNIRLTEYTYDESGNVLSESTDWGLSVEYDYFYDTYLTNYIPIDGTIDELWQYEYAENKYLIHSQFNHLSPQHGEMEDGTGYWYRCDEAGRITARGHEGNTEPFLTFTYDNQGRLIRKSSYDEVYCYTYLRANYLYDTDGRLSCMESENYNPDNQEWTLGYRINFKYDRSGNLVEVTQYYGDGTESCRNEMEYNLGRLVNTTCYRYGEKEEIREYAYDKNGNIAEVRVLDAYDGSLVKTLRYEYKELELSMEARLMYVKRNTWMWYMELAGFYPQLITIF